uniref:Uncharacterized protein n=1 Tax=Aegilops tauschii subsp. strangulata TaxID=200361 RepID=A0A453HP24_AEGTS
MRGAFVSLEKRCGNILIVVLGDITTFEMALQCYLKCRFMPCNYFCICQKCQI